ncbi:MAG: helicase-related protein, partial [Nanoarchaeota archaeon]
MTATATREVEKDIQTQLGISCEIIKASFDRPNLFFETISLKKETNKEHFFIDLIKKLHGSTIVFAMYQKTTENISALLTDAGIASTFYHAGLENEEREKRQNAFLAGQCQIIVATIAFGMGIDKADIRNIVHYNIPQSLENYYQEVGRAGRDGNPAHCIALFSKGDVFRLKSLLSDSWPNEKSIRRILTTLDNKKEEYSFVSPRSIAIECDTHEIPVKLVLHRLEEAGIIKIYPRVPFETKLLLQKKEHEIEQLLPEKKDELKKLFSDSFFHNPRRTWFSFEESIKETKMHYFRLLDLIRLLQKMDYLALVETKYKDIMLVHNDIN